MTGPFYGAGYVQGGYGPLLEDTIPQPDDDELRLPGDTPDLLVQVDFVHDVNPELGEELPEPIWTDLTAQLRQPDSFSYRRGRNRIGDRIEPGTAEFTFMDPDAELDPSNDDSPHAPNIVQNRRIRISGVVRDETEAFETGESETGGTDAVGGGGATTAVVMFDGFITGWVYEYPSQGFDATVKVSAVDWLGGAARSKFDLNTFVVNGDVLPNPVRYALDYLHLILDQKPFAGRRSFPHQVGADDPAQLPADHSRQIQNQVFSDAGMLEALLKVADTDGGLFFCDREGAFAYRGPDYLDRPVDDRYTFARGFQEYADVSFVYDDAVTFGIFTITTQFGVSTFSDPAAIRNAFDAQPTRTLDLLFEDPVDIPARGADLLRRQGRARKFVQRLDISNLIQDWPSILALELWDKVLLRVRLPSGIVVEQISLVEGIEVRSPRRGNWQIFLQLSDAPFPNLLTDAQADFETALEGWVAGANTELLRSNAPRLATRGAWALALTSVVEGDVSAELAGITIQPLSRYLFEAQFTIPTSFGPGGFGTERTGHLELEWRSQSGSLISTLEGEAGEARFGRPATLRVFGRAPLNARSATLRFVGDDVPVETHPTQITAADGIDDLYFGRAA